MKNTLLITLLAILSISISGCASRTIKLEQSNIRTAIMELYEEQLQDNLARAYKGKPFIHVTYTQATGDVTIATSPSIGFTKTNPSASGLTKVLNFVLGGSHTNKISVIARPVVDKPSLYEAIVNFAKTKYFGCTNKELPDNIHDNWPVDDYQCYVTKDGRDRYVKLFIQTTNAANTIEIKKTVEKVVSRKISDAEEISGKDGYQVLVSKKQHFILLTLDDELPNSDGTLIVTIDGNERKFDIQPVKTSAIGEDTKQLVLFYSEKAEYKGHNTVDELKPKLIDAIVTLKLNEYKVQRVPIEAFFPSLKLEREQLEQLRSN